MAPVLTKSGVPSNRREKIPEGTLCVVCDDLASGIHYSVASCNGCKTFFRRALVNKQTFSCQFNGECLVGKNVRCVCRSCRLKKCFEQGMDKNAIQHDRDKIRYTKVMKREKEAAAAAAAKIREETEREMMKVKEEIGSPGGPDCSDLPSSSRAFVTGPSELEMIMAPDTGDELDSTLKVLMKIEKKLTEVRNTYRFDDQISTIWNAYIGSRTMLSEDDWLASATELPPMLFSLTERNQSSESPYRIARITPWSLREWFQRDLTLMMEWVKLLPGGSNLTTSDKVCLQKAFALNFAVFQLTFYTRDTTVLGGSDFPTTSIPTTLADEITFEETLKSLKRRVDSPPPPAPFTAHIPTNLFEIATSLCMQPTIPKRMCDEVLGDEPLLLRKLAERPSIFSIDSSPSTSSFKTPIEPSFPSFLINNGLTGVSSFTEGINQMTNTIPSLPPTMSTGLPGALSNCLVSSLQASHSTHPVDNVITPLPNGFLRELVSLANSPCGLNFPPSPLFTASPLITSSPLMAASPYMAMAPSPLMAASLLSSISLANPFPTFVAPLPRMKTPEETIDVETVSMDGKSEGKGTLPRFSIESRIEPRPKVVPRMISVSRASTEMISNMNLMSMKSPDEPCSSKSLQLERVLSTSPMETESVPTSVAHTPIEASRIIKDEPLTPQEFGNPASVIRSTNDLFASGENTSELMMRSEKSKERSEERRKTSYEDEETPCDPTPEAQIMNRINYPDGSFIEREDKDRPFNDELYGLLIDGIWKVFRTLKIDQETFVLYKMMVFFNTELTDKTDHKLSQEGVDYVRKTREKMYVQLLLHLQRKRGKDGLRVFSNLLLLGSTISRVRTALRNMFTMASIFVPSNDLVDQLILRETDERAPSPSAFRPYHPSY